MKRLFIITAIFLFALGMLFSQDVSNKKPLTLDLIFKSGELRMESFRGIQHMNDGKHYCKLVNDSINLYDYKKGNLAATVVTKNYLIPPGDSLPIEMGRFSFGPREKKILFATNRESIYRHSYVAEYFIYDIESNKISALSINGKQMLADFDQDGNKLAFVRENNLFIKDLITDTEVQITNDGKNNYIINGTTDWVYEEEFGFTKGFYWSPAGDQIAWYKFNESEVPEYTLNIWGDLYPENETYKYPKAGEPNSVAEIWVYNLETKEKTKMDIGEDTDIYIPRIKWTKDNNILAVQWLNRLQNKLTILLANATSGESYPLYTETNKCYIDITDNLFFLDDGEHFIITSEQGGYNHVYLYDMLGNLENQITKGNWEVHELVGIDQQKEIVYYISSESSPLNRDFYSIKLDGTNKRLLSADLGSNHADFNKTYTHYINSFSSAETPNKYELYTSKGKFVRSLVSNDDYIEKLKDYQIVNKEFFTIAINDSIDLNAWMIKPFNFDPGKKYPVLMYVYGGPGSQTVLNNWRGGNSWYQYLASLGMIIVSVDNRGTGARGEEFKKMTYLNLGKYETEDQIASAKYLATLPYIDKDRIGIWGWSYGGYMATSCLAKGADIFSMAIAVAPVTNWRYYDNIYTERFMRTPQENAAGYDDNSPINHVEKIKGKLLLMHGTADDNVHFQNTLDLITALVDANVQFDLQIYPNSNHGIYTGRNTRYHLYTSMSNFIKEHLIKK